MEVRLVREPADVGVQEVIGAALTVRRARVHGAVDPATAPSRLAAVLAGGEVTPAGLPPAAVLCIRRLADPAPGLLPLDGGRLRPPPEWERAFVDQLTRLLAAAARPAREAVPANATAVYFADRAELLACLARDARDGSIWTRWWWRSLAPGGGARGDPVIDAWAATPEHVPAALALLASRGEADAFVAALPLALVRSLTVRVAVAFGAHELVRALERAAQPERPDRATRRVPAGPGARIAAAAPAAPAVAPWAAIVPEAAAQPRGLARAAFLGVALSLRRAPALALRPAFARAVEAWLEPGPGPAPVSAAAATPSPGEPFAALPDAPAAAARRRRGREPATRPQASAPPASKPPVVLDDAPRVLQEEPRPPAARPVARPAAERRATPATPTESVRAPDAPPGDVQPPPRRRRADRTELATREAAPRTSEPEPEVARRSGPVACPAPGVTDTVVEDDVPVIGVETGLGGVFYLLNLFLYLGLYGDFTSPQRPGIGLDPWECVARVARQLLPRERRGDPLWGILARLAGAHAFRPPRAWRVPRAWLTPFDADGTWRWSAANGTLRIAHPAGFLAVAVPRNGEEPHAQLERELRRLRVRPALRRASLGREPADPLDRWIARLASYARARLVLALDLDLERELFARRARVFITESHVDVVLSLSDLPLAVRFAGLDRTPGFVPAAGRFVAFHFE